MNLYASLLRRAPAVPRDLEEYLEYVRNQQFQKKEPLAYYAWKQEQAAERTGKSG